MVGAFRFWPTPSPPDLSHAIFSPKGEEVIHLEEVAPTRQQIRKPPPPTPLPPIPVPDDVILPEELPEIAEDFTLEALPEDATDEKSQQGLEGQGRTLQVEEAPRPVRFVEPEYTAAARKRKIRAQIVIEVLVDEKGRVVQARIVERFLLGKKPDEPPTPVDHIGYGLEEAALAAAQRWRFRPARQNGKPVQSLTTLTFRFGI